MKMEEWNALLVASNRRIEWHSDRIEWHSEEWIWCSDLWKNNGKKGCNENEKNRRKKGFYRWFPWQKSGRRSRTINLSHKAQEGKLLLHFSIGHWTPFLRDGPKNACCKQLKSQDNKRWTPFYATDQQIIALCWMLVDYVGTTYWEVQSDTGYYGRHVCLYTLIFESLICE